MERMSIGGVFVTEFMFFFKLFVFRVVEFFIRDKYEKKKYYDKNVIVIVNVSKIFIFIIN